MNNQGLKIRLAKPTEAETIVAFQLKMALETENLILEAKVVEQGVKAVFADKSKGQYWIAKSGSEIIASMLMTPEWSDWRNATVLWFQSVYVISEYRGKGVFRSMYEKLKLFVKQSENIAGLRLYVDKRNIAAGKVYEKLGMNGDHYNFFEWMEDF
ncbi:MAG: GNAT family N-acetyltransferase [Bacteroidota bacterium]|nr:GNAT family N-acetyltransferase [Bacteroidota bacterium]